MDIDVALRVLLLLLLIYTIVVIWTNWFLGPGALKLSDSHSIIDLSMMATDHLFTVTYLRMVCGQGDIIICLVCPRYPKQMEVS